MRANDSDNFIESVLFVALVAAPDVVGEINGGCVIDVTDIQGMRRYDVPVFETFESCGIPT